MLTGESRHCRFENLEFWAERGMITLIDTKDIQDSNKKLDEHTWRISPGTFLARAIAALVHEPDKYPDKLARLRRLVMDAKEVCLVAKQYGDPTDPSVLDHVIKHQRKHRIVMPHEMPSMAMPGLPDIKYKFSGTTHTGDILTKGYQITPDMMASAADIAAVNKLPKGI